MRPSILTLPFLSLCGLVSASITVQYQPQVTMVAEGGHNSTQLKPPALPNPMPNLAPFIQLNNAPPGGSSIQLPSSFLGFSIEMSVANQVLGHNSSLIQVPFLNLMHNIVQRCGAVKIRVGGNTQDYATVDVDSKIADLEHKILFKDYANRKSQNPTETPPVYLSMDFFYLLRNISSFTNVHWYLGIPFNDTNWRLDIVTTGQAILGDYLLGFQTANEPDFYLAHGHRSEPYGPDQYMGELKQLADALGDPKYGNAKSQFIAPSIANSNGWTLQTFWDKGFVDQFNDNIKFLAAERYPTDNCAAIWGGAGADVKNPQDEFPKYLSHKDYISDLVGQYLGDTAYAQTKNKPFLMFETNTASCGGFGGISDSFGGALWALDYGLQLAYGNFSGAMFHVGGQTTYYNPFTAPPTNETVFHQWTVGSTYYAVLVMSEIMGTSNTSQVLDLHANEGHAQTPAYVIFENGKPAKLALFNFMDKSLGNAELSVTFAIGGSGVNEQNGTPSTVKVKYFQSDSVSDKGNFRWAGQTLGAAYGSDGRLQGTEDVQSVNCNPDNTCTVKVPAPAFALVFLNGDPNPTAAAGAQTFSTTAVTQTRNTATIPSDVMATSNGHINISQKKYSTSFGSGNKNGAMSAATVSWLSIGLSLGLGLALVGARRP